VKERRATRRRRPLSLRSAVLEAGGRSHVVALADLSAEGAFLATRMAVSEATPLRLRVVLPLEGGEVALPCAIVRKSESFDAATGQPAGVAVRFGELEPRVARRLSSWTGDAQAGVERAERVEYRVLERPELSETELNALGRDGWELCGVVPSSAGLRLVLLRRL
jgi:PilZ domain